jgi:hypothetical protein
MKGQPKSLENLAGNADIVGAWQNTNIRENIQFSSKEILDCFEFN